jgi:hypothetical protein
MRQSQPVDDTSGIAALGALVTFGVGASLVGVRGELRPEIVVLALALSVVVAGRWGGRAGGVAAAVMAATSFDFFFTKPYLSLKIASSNDVAVTAALLAVGLVAGGLSARARRDHRLAMSRELDVDAIRRLLDVAGECPVEDVELAVRAELLKLLELAECAFTRDPVSLPALGATGALPRIPLIHRRDGFQLPEHGVTIPVTAAGQQLGSLVCTPVPGVGIGLSRRRTAVAAAHILGLAMVARPASPRGAH